jgi:hypothetical protein
LALSSFIVDGGTWMQVVVRAATPGQAIAAAQRYRDWLLERGAWGTRATALEVLDAATVADAAQRMPLTSERPASRSTSG